MHQPAIGAEFLPPGLAGFVLLPIKDDGLARISNQLLVRLQRVGHVGKREHGHRQPLTHPLGIDGSRQFKKSTEVRDLVIAPVANIAPRVVGLRNFPVDAFSSDPVRIEAIKRGGIDELQNEMIHPTWVRQSQRFPVLENVTPIALVRQTTRTILVAHANVEHVPRPGGITMATSKPEGEVFIGQPKQLRVIVGLGFTQQFGAGAPSVSRS